MLRGAIKNLLATTPTMKGDILLRLNRASGKLNFVPGRISKGEEAIMKKHIKADKKGELKTIPLTDEELEMQKEGKIPADSRGTWDYKTKSGLEDAQKEMNEMMDNLVVVELRPILESDFAKLDIQAARNPNIDLIIEHMVVEGLKVA